MSASNVANLGNILVTGGAGYIGSHVVKSLCELEAAKVIILDNLQTGYKENVLEGQFIQGNVQDIALVSQILTHEKIDTVIHLAALTVIPDSIADPLKYYDNNVIGTLNLLKACVQHHVKNFIFSSTAAVYAFASNGKISEQNQILPVNPYGYSKFLSEQIIKDVAQVSPIRYAILRYFNVAGACPSGKIGQRAKNATHLIKVAVQTACGLRETMPIFGIQYPTPDGTCIRDFIHVSDLADAHIKALEYLKREDKSITLNCGYGKGFSVKEVIEAVEKVSQKSLPIQISAARQGDLPQVVADNTLIKEVLQWRPQFNDLHFIVKTALDFERQL